MDISMNELEQLLTVLPGEYLVIAERQNSGEVIAYTKGVPELHGMTEAEFAQYRGADALTLLVPDDRYRGWRAMEDGFIGQRDNDSVYRMVHKTMDRLWLHLRSNYHMRLDGRPACIVAMEQMDPADTQKKCYDQILEEAERAMQDRNLLAAAARAIFPLCIAVNLTENKYHLIECDHSDIEEIKAGGVFDDLVRLELKTVGEQERTAFAAAFSRENLLAAHARGERSVTLIHSQQSKDGAWHRSRTTVIFVDAPDSSDVMAVTLTDCLDEQIATEAALEKKSAQLAAALEVAERASHAKSDFLSSMSHDIRTPLNAIVNLTNLLHEELDDPQKLEEDIQKIEVASEFLLQLINDVLDISTIESGKLTLNPRVYTYSTFLNYIKGIIVPLCDDKDIRFILDEGPTALDIYMDRVRFHQVFFNILSNAVKYTPPGGTVMFRTTNNVVHDGILTCDFIVSDTGCGMSQEFLAHAFEPFMRQDQTSAYVGTGLGLAICKRLVDLMGGTIHIDSEEGKGTTVTVHMDLLLATEEQKAASQVELDTSYRRRAVPEGAQRPRVLVVEDNMINREILARLVEKRNYLVECATNGREAVDMIEEHDGNYYQIVLMDIRMPVMDGLKATELIRKDPDEQKSHLPIIAITANAFENDMRQCLEAGMNAGLAKPIAPNDLYNMLANYTQMEE